MKTDMELSIVPFTGFYSGPWSTDFFENGITDIKETYGDLEHAYEWDFQDFDAWSSLFAMGYSEAFLDLVSQHLGISFKPKSAYVWMPHDYSSSNDRLYCVVEPEPEWRSKLVALMDKHSAKLSEWIYDNHTSYDGFCSFMENDFQSWRSIISEGDGFIGRRQAVYHIDDSAYVSYAISYLLLIIMGISNWRLQEIISETLADDYDIWYPAVKPDSEEAEEEWERVKARHDYLEALRAMPSIPGLE